MIELSPAQAVDRIAKLLATAESRMLEFKRISDKHKKIIETVCAFANSEGGLLALGVGDAKDLRAGDKPQRRLWGVEENPEAFDDLRRLLLQRFTPALTRVHWLRLPCTLRDGQPGHVVLLRVEKSDQVHSVVGNGTWTRMDASNRELNAAEIADLAYRRGIKSAETEPVAVPLDLLDTQVWRSFVSSRGLRAGNQAEQLLRIGLAEKVKHADGTEEVLPRLAAVLLFAQEPGSLLAGLGTRADIRLLVYDGKAAVSGATPNFRKKPKTVRGPLIDQIDEAVRLVLDALTEGVTLASSGFQAKHVYPDRVVKEAIVNAVVHRDYRLNRDIFIRIFDDHIEVESPGAFPGSITPENVVRMSSKARNPLIAQNLREFPVPPNIDAGEGVKMMFAEMASAKLYPPQYRQSLETAVETVTVTLFNLERPSAWDEVSDWIDREGAISNAKLCDIAKVDTLKASRMLVAWRDQGLLVAVPGRAKRNMAYTKPTKAEAESGSLLSGLEDNNAGGDE